MTRDKFREMLECTSGDTYGELLPTERSRVLEAYIRAPWTSPLDEMAPDAIDEAAKWEDCFRNYLADFAQATKLLEHVGTSPTYAGIRDMAARRLASLILSGVEARCMREANEYFDDINAERGVGLSDEWIEDHMKRAEELR